MKSTVLTLIVLSVFYAEIAETEAFFVSSLLRGGRSLFHGGLNFGRPGPPPPPRPFLPHRPPQRPRHRPQHFTKPSSSHNSVQTKPMKLDFGGWQPIGSSNKIKPIAPAPPAPPAPPTPAPVSSAQQYQPPQPEYKPVSTTYAPEPIISSTAAPVYQPPVISYDQEPVSVVLPVYTPSPLAEYQNAGSPDSLPFLNTNTLNINQRNVKDVHHHHQEEQSKPQSDELFYIYYKDTSLNPVKTEYQRDTSSSSSSSSSFLGLQGLDIPLYDYDEAADVFRAERDQPTFFGPFGDKSISSVSFKQDVGGHKSGYTYTITQ